MTTNKIAMTGTRFFTSTLLDQPQDTPIFISVGEELFQAFSVTLIDLLLSKQRLSETLLEKMVTKFFLSYPKFKTGNSYSSYSAYMPSLINNPHRAEMIACMAQVIKQLAFDEVLNEDNALKYRDILKALPANVSYASLSSSSIPLPQTIFRALAQVSDLNIELSIIEPNKKLRKRESYQPEAGPVQLKVELQLQNGNYFPKIKTSNKAYFAAIGQSSIKTPDLILDAHCAEGTLNALIKKAAANDKNLKHSFDSALNNLTLLLKAGANFENLKATYMKFAFLPESLFITSEELNNANKQPSNVINSSSSEQLINTVAEWMVTHSPKEVEEFFEHFESLPNSYPGLKTRIAKPVYSGVAVAGFLADSNRAEVRSDFSESPRMGG